jgi:hypothetical protein
MSNALILISEVGNSLSATPGELAEYSIHGQSVRGLITRGLVQKIDDILVITEHGEGFLPDELRNKVVTTVPQLASRLQVPVELVQRVTDRMVKTFGEDVYVDPPHITPLHVALIREEVKVIMNRTGKADK